MESYRPYEIIFVDDSDDDTPSILSALAQDRDDVRVLFLARQWGQSAALAAGFDDADGEFIVPMDADLQNDPADIPALFNRLEDGYDCVSGHRTDRDDPWHKTIPSAIQTKLAKATGPDINDFGCTLKVYRREALRSLELRGESHRYIPARLYDQGFSIAEVDINHRPRVNGESRYGAGRLVRGFVDLLYHWFAVEYSSRPMHLLGGLGMLSMVSGVSIGVVSVVQRYIFNVALAPRAPRLILVVLLLTLGLQLLVFGVIAEMLTDMKYNNGELSYRVERVEE